MIIKDKEIKKTVSATAKAGQKHELDVAFYLRRAFKDDYKVFVFNDFKITHNEETAQIDHLILYPFGFILIESKSITGQVKVNEHQEWTRSYNGKWQGMPSPIKQVELQQKLLKELLHKHRADIIGKVLLKQQTFGRRCWDNICAVSNKTIIDRKQMPKEISQKLVKSEFLKEKLQEIMKLRNPVINSLNVLDTRPHFSKDELLSIVRFLKAQDISSVNKSLSETEEHITTELAELPSASESVTHKNTSNMVSEPSSALNIATLKVNCSKCSEDGNLEHRSGRYGHFLKCTACGGNTPLKRPCPSCNSKETKVNKKQDQYSLTCSNCSSKVSLVAKATCNQPS